MYVNYTVLKNGVAGCKSPIISICLCCLEPAWVCCYNATTGSVEAKSSPFHSFEMYWPILTTSRLSYYVFKKTLTSILLSNKIIHKRFTRITSSYPSTPLQGSLCRRCGCWSLQRKTALEQASCLSKKPKYGEAGAWPGGDKEDEGGGHRNCESPYQGLYLDNALGFIMLGIKSNPFEVSALYFFKKCMNFFAGGLRGHGKSSHPPHPHSPTLPFHPGCVFLNSALPCPLFHPGPCYTCLPVNCLSQNHHAAVNRGPGQQPALLGLCG